jgi:hypothetical protein
MSFPARPRGHYPIILQPKLSSLGLDPHKICSIDHDYLLQAIAMTALSNEIHASYKQRIEAPQGTRNRKARLGVAKSTKITGLEICFVLILSQYKALCFCTLDEDSPNVAVTAPRTNYRPEIG